MPSDQFLRLGGYWDEPELYSIQIYLSKCVNSSSSAVICQSEENIEDFFNKLNYFSYYITQNNVDETTITTF